MSMITIAAPAAMRLALRVWVVRALARCIPLPDEDLNFLRAYSEAHGTSAEAGKAETLKLGKLKWEGTTFNVESKCVPMFNMGSRGRKGGEEARRKRVPRLREER
jgi:hypothetical protein